MCFRRLHFHFVARTAVCKRSVGDRVLLFFFSSFCFPKRFLKFSFGFVIFGIGFCLDLFFFGGFVGGHSWRFSLTTHEDDDDDDDELLMNLWRSR